MTGIFFPLMARWLHAIEPKPQARPKPTIIVTTTSTPDPDRAKRHEAALERMAKATKKCWSA